MGRPHKCPYCEATETVSKGVRKTKTMGHRRIRLCKACKRKFTPRNQKAGDATADAETEQGAGSTPEPVMEAAPESVPSPVNPLPAVPANEPGQA